MWVYDFPKGQPLYEVRESQILKCNKTIIFFDTRLKNNMQLANLSIVLILK